MFCSRCGHPVLEKDKFCISCGAPLKTEQPAADMLQQVEQFVNHPAETERYEEPQHAKSRLEAFLLCLLLGYFGAHYFYAGRFGMGILYLCTFGLFGFGWFVDLLRILCGRFRDSRGRCI